MLHVCLSRSGCRLGCLFAALLIYCVARTMLLWKFSDQQRIKFSTEGWQGGHDRTAENAFEKKNIASPYSVNVAIRFRGLVSLPHVPTLQIGNVCIQTVNYIMSNETYVFNQNEVEMLGSTANLTITNFEEDHDYLSFLFSIYYKSDIALVLSVDENISSEKLSTLIRQTLLEFISLSPSSTTEKPYILLHNPELLCISNTLLRQVLMYSSIRFSDPSLYSLLPSLLPSEFHGKWMHSSQFLLHLRAPSASNITFSKCFSMQIHPNSSFSVFLRLFQRNYLRAQLKGVFSQSLRPEFLFLIQNKNLTQFDYPAILQEFEGFGSPIYFFWNVNWNAFFHLSYLLSGFTPSPLSFTYDDDQILVETDIHAKALRAMIARPGIHSLRAWCWCKRYLQRAKLPRCVKQCEKAPDLVVNPFFAPSWVGKVMWRYDIPTYFCCEEMSYLLTANIQCGVRWFWLNATYQSFQKDKLDRKKDAETMELMKRVDWKNLEHVAMTYYTKAGYKTSYAYDLRYLKMNQSVYPIFSVCSVIKSHGLLYYDANIPVSAETAHNMQSMLDYTIVASIWRPGYSFMRWVKTIDVYTLTDTNFETLVGTGTNGTWFIHFYAPVTYFGAHSIVVVLIM